MKKRHHQPLLALGALLLVAGLAGSLLAGGGLPRDPTPANAAEDLIVHEWGTFTSFSGADGKHLQFYPDYTDLPDFVYSSTRYKKIAMDGTTVSMETPVIYFYNPKELNLDVQVKFPQGRITEWYPQANQMSADSKQFTWKGIRLQPPPKAVRVDAVQVQRMIGDLDSDQFASREKANRELEKLSVSAAPALRKVLEGNPSPEVRQRIERLLNAVAPPKFPEQPGEKRYYAARETDAAPLLATIKDNNHERRENEKFIFYRGVGNFALPLSFRANGGGKFTVKNTGKDPLTGLILVHVLEKTVHFQEIGSLAGGAQTIVQQADTGSGADKLGAVMEKSLQAAGLFEKEARAMVKTWNSAWFGEEGTRLLYLLPRSATDELLPLEVTPRPAATVRVLVGRHDILTPEREREVARLAKEMNNTAKAEAAQKAFNKLGLGRFASPALIAATARK